jgi:hypothetical protein
LAVITGWGSIDTSKFVYYISFHRQSLQLYYNF